MTQWGASLVIIYKKKRKREGRKRRKQKKREEKERAKWKLTGSREGISEFRSRLLAREENAILFINIILIITLVIIVWEITKKFINQNSEEEVKENSQRMLAHKIKIRHLDTTHSCHPLHRREIILDEDKLVRRRNRLTITRIFPSTFCDNGGMSLSI